MSTIAEVSLWGSRIGAVHLKPKEPFASFQYDPDFQRSALQVAPLTMPLSAKVYRFPSLAPASFHGLPGLLADCLPDKFGNALIDAWLVGQGRAPSSFTALERLCYLGSRGMGALEFHPAQGPSPVNEALQIGELVSLASAILQQRRDKIASLESLDSLGSIKHILQVGTSAGGARAKAVIAWNPQTRELRSGQLQLPEGFQHWLIKFDGVAGNKDKENEDPKHFGSLEYAYFLMARSAGITMSPCQILAENGRRHFMTRRFDRGVQGKIHMQSLAAIAHYDFNMAGAYSYEQAMSVIKQLGLPASDREEFYRRTIFNIVCRNQDDHVKNIAFLMDRRGNWSLSPAFDMTYSYNPAGQWTSSHQMSLAGKRDNFTLDDLKSLESHASLPKGRWKDLYHQVCSAARQWDEFATQAEVPLFLKQEVANHLRL